MTRRDELEIRAREMGVGIENRTDEQLAEAIKAAVVPWLERFGTDEAKLAAVARLRSLLDEA